MTDKKYKIPADKLRRVAPGHGGCMASDRILVGGMQVGFMYRELPAFEGDSGWRFFSGDESRDYADDPKNFAIYDVNTVANYDEDIVAFLFASVGSEFARERLDAPLERVEGGKG